MSDSGFLSQPNVTVAVDAAGKDAGKRYKEKKNKSKEMRTEDWVF
jgi:hypothetical protein